jgi:hypothetical protein
MNNHRLFFAPILYAMHIELQSVTTRLSIKVDFLPPKHYR